MSTVANAREEMMTAFRTAWLANGTSSPVPIGWDRVDFARPADDADGHPSPYALVTVRHTNAETEAIGGENVGRCLHVGFFIVRIYGPTGRGHVVTDPLAQVARRALQGKRFGSGWWHSVRIIEMPGPDPEQPKLSCTSVVAEFTYEERLGE